MECMWTHERWSPPDTGEPPASGQSKNSTDPGSPWPPKGQALAQILFFSLQVQDEHKFIHLNLFCYLPFDK